MKKSSDRTRFGRLMAGAAPFALALAAVSSPANAIVPNDNFTPDDIVDEDDVYAGVGQFFRNALKAITTRTASSSRQSRST